MMATGTGKACHTDLGGSRVPKGAKGDGYPIVRDPDGNEKRTWGEEAEAQNAERD